MDEILNKIKRSYLGLTAWRVALLYITLSLTRLLFYIYNYDIVGAISPSELGSLIKGSLTFDTVSIIYSCGLWIVLALLPLKIRVKRWYRETLFWIYITITSIFIIGLNICDAIYYHYALKRFTASELLFTDNDNNAQVALEAFGENWHAALLAIALIFLVVKCYRRSAKVEDSPKRAILFYPINTLILLLSIGGAIGGVRGGFSHDIRPLTLSNAMQYTSDSEKSYMILSNPFCILRTIGKSSVKVPKYFSKEVADSLFTPLHYPTATESRYRGYNVVLFIMESFSAENSAHLSPDLYSDGERGYMPFLDSLMRDGVTLRKMYANGARSISATPAILGSIPSFETPFILMANSIAPSRQLPAMLRDMGYATIFACGSSRSSMGFAAYAQSAGVDRYISREDYEAKYGESGFDGTWGIWDEEFVDLLGEELCQTPEPFFAAQFTISSHHPFEVPERYKEVLPRGETAIQQGTAYTDMAIRKLFENYGDREWFKRTIFVFTADHVSSEKMADRTRKYPGNHHILGAMYTPDGSLRAEVNEVTQQLDLMPTILALTGNEQPFFAFGRDIFSKDDNRPQWSVSHVGELKAYTTDEEILSTSDSELLRAFEQQYFDHISRRDYLAK
ncbi:MAG: sulfatase-like hydrolase/transferase [Rikenellaceae bacterium]